MTNPSLMPPELWGQTLVNIKKRDLNFVQFLETDRNSRATRSKLGFNPACAGGGQYCVWQADAKHPRYTLLLHTLLHTPTTHPCYTPCYTRSLGSERRRKRLRIVPFQSARLGGGEVCVDVPAAGGSQVGLVGRIWPALSWINGFQAHCQQG